MFSALSPSDNLWSQIGLLVSMIEISSAKSSLLTPSFLVTFAALEVVGLSIVINVI